jgi:signal transduction histidine kinase
MQGDAGTLRQVFLNLLLNAMQAITGEGTIEVSTVGTPGWLEARVADNGSGIPPELIDQIWNPFFTTKAVGKGSGLGLALVYDIVKNHGGEITVASTVGKGTEFTVRFPACQ